MDLFATSGLMLPRNSSRQSVAGTRHVDVDALDDEAKMAAIEQARARQSVILDARRLRAARGELGRLLGLPLETAGLEGELAPPPPVASTLATLTERALAKRPDIEALEARAQRGKAQIRLARSDAWPKPTLSAGYAREDGSDRIASVGLSLPLPLFNRNQVRVAEAQAEARRQQLALERQRLQVEREVVLAFEADRSASDDQRSLWRRLEQEQVVAAQDRNASGRVDRERPLT